MSRLAKSFEHDQVDAAGEVDTEPREIRIDDRPGHKHPVNLCHNSKTPKRCKDNCGYSGNEFGNITNNTTSGHGSSNNVNGPVKNHIVIREPSGLDQDDEADGEVGPMEEAIIEVGSHCDNSKTPRPSNDKCGHHSGNKFGDIKGNRTTGNGSNNNVNGSLTTRIVKRN